MSGLPERGLQAAVISFAVRFRGIVIALALVLCAYGGHAILSKARYDVFPEFAPPQVAIQAEAPGLTPEQVEMLVTRPIETAVNGMTGVEALRSASVQGLSIITVVFRLGSDIHQARQVVAERLVVAAAQLPQGVAPPRMTPLTSSTSTVLVVGLSSERRTPMELRTVADWAVRRRLLAVPGVAQVGTYGGEVRSVQVQVRPDDLVRFDVGLNDVVAAAQRASGVRGAGFVETPNQRIALQTQGQSLTPAELAGTVLRHAGGASVTLGEVADVVDAPEPPIGGGAVDGHPAVVLMVSQQYGSNTLEVTRRVEAALEELRPALERDGVTLHAALFRPASFIETATGNVLHALMLGGGLVVIVLFVFLFDWRTSLISCTAIPLSLLAAVLALGWLGETLNTLTLGGLAIAIGEVVDDAVIGVENVVRRLRENRLLPAPRTEGRVVLEAVLEVRSAVVYATFAVVLVFLPVLALTGVAGRLFAPLGIAYILAVLASLVVALTVTPALSMLLLTGRRAPAVGERDAPVARFARDAYAMLLRRVERRAGWVVAGALAATVAGAAALPTFGSAFLPELKEGHFVLHVTAVPGTSLAETLRIGKHVAAALRDVPGVRSVTQRAGRAEASEETKGVHGSEFEVSLRPGLGGEQQEATEVAIRTAVSGIPGINVALKTFLTERIEETVSGFAAAVAVSVFGDDLDALDRSAAAVARELGEVRGAADVQLLSPPGMPQVTIALRSAELQRWGFNPVDVLDVVRIAHGGEIVGQTHAGTAVFNTIVILAPEARDRVAAIGDLLLRSPAGRHVPLRQLAEVFETSGRYQVLHQAGQRAQTVTANVIGRDVASFVTDARARIAREVALPAGSYIEFGGAAEAEARSRLDLAINALAAGAGIVLLLSVVTRNARNLLLVLVNLPFAFVGGVAAVFATDGLLSLGSLVGFVTLFGITLRNSIMMISHYEHLVAIEGRAWGPETAVTGAADRLVPILMTSLVTALGLLPLALGMDEPGREIEGPMAVVILGGLMTSMVLNLLVLPTLALRFGRFEVAADAFAAAVPIAGESARGSP